MAVNSKQIHLALAKIRNANTEAEANAARNQAKNLGAQAMRRLTHREDQLDFAVSLDAEITLAWRQRPVRLIKLRAPSVLGPLRL